MTKDKTKTEEPLVINRYRLKPGVTEADISKYNIRPGGSWISKFVTMFMVLPLAKDITLNIGFTRDLSAWDDFEHILVLDEDFGQPYLPFYKFLDGTETKNCSPFLRRVILNYNEAMDELEFLEKIDKNDDVDDGKD